MDHSEMLSELMSLSGKDFDECKRILEESDWNLQKAVEKISTSPNQSHSSLPQNNGMPQMNPLNSGFFPQHPSMNFPPGQNPQDFARLFSALSNNLFGSLQHFPFQPQFSQFQSYPRTPTPEEL